jgi:hypothetical protein
MLYKLSFWIKFHFGYIFLQQISHFLKQVGKQDYLDLVREFRNWVKSQI